MIQEAKIATGQSRLNSLEAHILQRLQSDLAQELVYHNHEHTIAVYTAAKYLAAAEGLDEKATELVAAAALMHDVGFLETYENHELHSCNLAREWLPQFHYNHTEIEHICRLIICTRLPQQAYEKDEMVLCDADMYYFGAADYFPVSVRLLQEREAQGIKLNEQEWLLMQVQFLQSHRYFTKTAVREQEGRKRQHLRSLRQRLSEVTAPISGNTKKKRVTDVLFMITGILFAGFALNSFLVPNKFFDGGVTGISLLLHKVYGFNLAGTILIANLPFIVAAYFLVNKSFALKTLSCVLLLGICLLYLPYPVVTSDKLIISVFGGFFLGIGVGLCMRGGCALDGIEVLALYTFKRSSFTVSEISLGLNTIIFLIAAFVFGLETALYSILTYFSATKTIDYVVEGIQAYTGVTIISGKSDAIKFRLVNELGRGITVYKGERGFLPGQFNMSNGCDIIFTVVTRLEMRRLNNLVHEIDPKAFVFASTIKEASGGILRRKAAHH